MKSFLRSLYGRISLLYLVLSIALVLLGAWVTVRHFDLFINGVEQKLNRNLATKVAGELNTALQSNTQEAAIQKVTDQLTMVHPALELYLLDQNGRIQAASPPPEQLERQRIDLTPVRAFIDGQASLPLWGEYPCVADEEKVFSAAPFTLADGQPGYLYIILRGKAAGTAASMLQNTYILRILAFNLLITLGFAIVVGLLLFGLLTRRFRSLTDTVQAFKEGDYDRRVDVTRNDEIGQLGRAFNEMADTIAAQVEALRRTDEARRELVAQVSHDFRTPLTSIRGHAERMLNRPQALSDSDRNRRLQMIVQNAERLDRLADQLHELSRLDARQSAPSVERFSIAELVQDLTLKFQPQAETRTVTLTADVNPSLPSVYGDIGLVERMLSNLVDNALDNTPAGGTVQIELQEHDDTVAVQVVDTGVGIPTNELPLITQRFYRINRDGNNGSGSGLGLAIAAEIAEAHGSTLEFESAVDEGTTVTVHLPLSPSAVPREQE